MKKKTLSWILCGVFCLAFIGLCITLALTIGGKKNEDPSIPETPTEVVETPLHEFASIFAWKDEFSKLANEYDARIPEETTVCVSSSLFTAVKDSTDEILLINNKTGNQVNLEGYSFENINIYRNFVILYTNCTFIDGQHTFVGYLYIDDNDVVHEIYCDNLLKGGVVYIRPNESVSLEVVGDFFVKILESDEKYQILLWNYAKVLAGESFEEIDLGDCISYDVFENYIVLYTPTKTKVFNLLSKTPASPIFEFTNTTITADGDDYTFIWQGEYFYFENQHVVNGITSKHIFVDIVYDLGDEYGVLSGIYNLKDFEKIDIGISDAEFSLNQVLSNGYILIETSTLFNYFDEEMNLKISFDKNFGAIRFATDTYFITDNGILVDFSGKLIKLPEGLSVLPFTYQNGFFIAFLDGKAGIVNQKFETIVDFVYDDITNFDDGVAIGKVGSTYYRILKNGQRFVVVDFDSSTYEREELVFFGTGKYISSSDEITSIRNIDGSLKSENVDIESISHESSSSSITFVNAFGERFYSVFFYPAFSSSLFKTYSNDFVDEYKGLSGSAIQGVSYGYRLGAFGVKNHEKYAESEAVKNEFKDDSGNDLRSLYKVVLYNNDIIKKESYHKLNDPNTGVASDDSFGQIGSLEFTCDGDSINIEIKQVVDTNWNIQVFGGGYGSNPVVIPSKDRKDFLKVIVNGSQHLYLSKIYCKFVSWYDNANKNHEILKVGENDSPSLQKNIVEIKDTYTDVMTLDLMNNKYYRWNAPMYIEITLRTRYSGIKVSNGSGDGEILQGADGVYKVFPGTLQGNASAEGFYDDCKTKLGITNTEDLTFLGLYGASQSPIKSIDTNTNYQYFEYSNNTLNPISERVMYNYSDNYKTYNTLYAMFSREFTLQHGGGKPENITIYFTLDQCSSGTAYPFTLNNANKLDGFSFDGWYTDSTNFDPVKQITIKSNFTTLYARYSFNIEFQNYVESFKYYGINDNESLYMNSRSYSFLGDFDYTETDGYTKHWKVFEYIDYSGNPHYVGVHSENIQENNYNFRYNISSGSINENVFIPALNMIFSLEVETNANYMGSYKRGEIFVTKNSPQISFSEESIALCNGNDNNGFTIFERAGANPNNIATFSGNNLIVGTGTYSSSDRKTYASEKNGSGVISAYDDQIEYAYTNLAGKSQKIVLDKNANTVVINEETTISLSKGNATFSDDTYTHSWSLEEGNKKTYTIREIANSNEILFAITFTSSSNITTINIGGSVVGVTDGSTVTLDFNAELGLFVSSSSAILKKQSTGENSFDILLGETSVLSVKTENSITHDGITYYYNSELGVYIPGFYLKYDETNKKLNVYSWDEKDSSWKSETIFNAGGDEIIFNGQTFVWDESNYTKTINLSSEKKNVLIYDGKIYTKIPNDTFVGSDSGVEYSIELGRRVFEYNLFDFDEYGRAISTKLIYSSSQLNTAQPFIYGGKTYNYNNETKQFERVVSLKKIVSAIFVEGDTYRYYSNLAASTGSTSIAGSSVTHGSGKLTYDGREFVKYRDTNLYIYSVTTFDVDKYESTGTNKYGYKISIDTHQYEFQRVGSQFAVGSEYVLSERNLNFEFSDSSVDATIDSSDSGEFFERVEDPASESDGTFTFLYRLARKDGFLTNENGDYIDLRVFGVTQNGVSYDFVGAFAQLVIDGDNVSDEIEIGSDGFALDIPAIALHFTSPIFEGKFGCDEDSSIFVEPYLALNEFEFFHTTYGFTETTVEGVTLKIWNGTTQTETHTSQQHSTTTSKTFSISDIKFEKEVEKNVRYQGYSAPSFFVNENFVLEFEGDFPAYNIKYGDDNFLVVEDGEQKLLFHKDGESNFVNIESASIKKIFMYEKFRIEYTDNQNFSIIEIESDNEEFVWYEFKNGVGMGRATKELGWFAVTYENNKICAPDGSVLSEFDPATGGFKVSKKSISLVGIEEKTFVFEIGEKQIRLILARKDGEGNNLLIDRMIIEIESDAKWIECQFGEGDIIFAMEFENGVQTSYTKNKAGNFVSNQIIEKRDESQYIYQIYNYEKGEYEDSLTVLDIEGDVLIFNNILYARIVSGKNCFASYDFLSISDGNVFLHKFVNNIESNSPYFEESGIFENTDTGVIYKDLTFLMTPKVNDLTPNINVFVNGIYLLPPNIENLSASFCGSWKVGSSETENSIINLENESDSKWVFSTREYGSGLERVIFEYDNKKLKNIIVKNENWFAFDAKGFDSNLTDSDFQFGLFNTKVKVGGVSYNNSRNVDGNVKEFTYISSGTYIVTRNTSGGIESLQYNDGKGIQTTIFQISGGAVNEYGTTVSYNGKTFSKYDPVSNIYENEDTNDTDNKFFQFDGEVFRTFSNRNLSLGSYSSASEQTKIYIDATASGYNINKESIEVNYKINVDSFSSYLFDSVVMGKTSTEKPWTDNDIYKKYISGSSVGGYTKYQQASLSFISMTICTLFSDLNINIKSRGVLVKNFFGIRPIANIRLDSQNTNGENDEGYDDNSSISMVSANGSKQIYSIDSLNDIIFQNISQKTLRRVGATAGNSRIVVFEPNEVRYVKKIVLSQIGITATTDIVIAWNEKTGKITGIESGIKSGKIGGGGQNFEIKLDFVTGKILIYFKKLSIDVKISVEYERRHFESTYKISEGAENAKIETYNHILYDNDYQYSNARKNNIEVIKEYNYATYFSPTKNELTFVKDFSSGSMVMLAPNLEERNKDNVKILAYFMSEVVITNKFLGSEIGWIRCEYDSLNATYKFSMSENGVNFTVFELDSNGKKVLNISGISIKFMFAQNKYKFEEVNASAPLEFSFVIKKIQVENAVEKKGGLDANVDVFVNNVKHTGQASIKTSITAKISYTIYPTSTNRMLDNITVKIGDTSYNFFVGRLNSDNKTVFADSSLTQPKVVQGTYVLYSESSAWSNSLTGYNIKFLTGTTYSIVLGSDGSVVFDFTNNERDVSVAANECFFFKVSMYNTAESLDRTTIENSRENSIIPYVSLKIDDEGVSMGKYMYILSREISYKPVIEVVVKSGYTGIIVSASSVVRAQTNTFVVPQVNINQYNIYASSSGCNIVFELGFENQFGNIDSQKNSINIAVGSAISKIDAMNEIVLITSLDRKNLSNGYFVAVKVESQMGYKIKKITLSALDNDGNTVSVVYEYSGNFVTFQVANTGNVTYKLRIEYVFDIIIKELYSADSVSIEDGNIVPGKSEGYLYFIYNSSDVSAAVIYFSKTLFDLESGFMSSDTTTLSGTNIPRTSGKSYLQLKYWVSNGVSFDNIAITSENKYSSLLNFESIDSQRDNPNGICVVVWSAEIINVSIIESKIGKSIRATIVFGSNILKYHISNEQLKDFVDNHSFDGLFLGEKLESTRYLFGNASPAIEDDFYVYTLNKSWNTAVGNSGITLTAYYSPKQFTATFKIGDENIISDEATFNEQFKISIQVATTINSYKPSFTHIGWVNMAKSKVTTAYLSRSVDGNITAYDSSGKNLGIVSSPRIYDITAFIWDEGNDITFVPCFMNNYYKITLVTDGDISAPQDTVIPVESGGNINVSAIGEIGEIYLSKVGYTFDGFGNIDSSGQRKFYFVKIDGVWRYGNTSVYFDTSLKKWMLANGEADLGNAVVKNEANNYLLVYFDINGQWCSSNVLQVVGLYTKNEYLVKFKYINFENNIENLDKIITTHIAFGERFIVTNFNVDDYNYIRKIVVNGTIFVLGKYNASENSFSSEKQKLNGSSSEQTFLSVYQSGNVFQIDITLVSQLLGQNSEVEIEIYVDRETRFVTFMNGSTALNTVVVRRGDALRTGVVYAGVYNLEKFYAADALIYKSSPNPTPPIGEQLLYWRIGEENFKIAQVENRIIDSNLYVFAVFGSTSATGYYINYFVYDTSIAGYTLHSTVDILKDNKGVIQTQNLLNLGHKVGFSSGGKTYFIFGWKSSSPTGEVYYRGVSDTLQINSSITPTASINFYAVYDELIFEVENKTQDEALKSVISARVQLPRSYASIEYAASDVIWYVSDDSTYSTSTSAVEVGRGENFYVSNISVSKKYLHAVIINKDDTSKTLLSRTFDIQGVIFGIGLSYSSSDGNNVVDPSKTTVTSSDISKTLGTVRFVGLTYAQYQIFINSQKILYTEKLKDAVGTNRNYIKSGTSEDSSLVWATDLESSNNIAKYGYQYFVAILSNENFEVCTKPIDLSEHVYIKLSYSASDLKLNVKLSDIKLVDANKIVILSAKKDIGTEISANDDFLLSGFILYPNASSILVSTFSRYCKEVTVAILNSANQVISKKVDVVNIESYYTKDVSYTLSKGSITATETTYSVNVPEFARNNNYFYAWVSLDYYMKMTNSNRLTPSILNSNTTHFAFYTATNTWTYLSSGINDKVASLANTNKLSSSTTSVSLKITDNNAVMYLAFAIFDAKTKTLVSLSSNVSDLYYGDKIYSFSVGEIREYSTFIYRRYYSYYQWYIKVLYGIDVNNYISIDASPYKYKINFGKNNLLSRPNNQNVYEFDVYCKWMYTIHQNGWDFDNNNRNTRHFDHIDYYTVSNGYANCRDYAVGLKNANGSITHDGILISALDANGKITLASSHNAGLKFGIFVFTTEEANNFADGYKHALRLGTPRLNVKYDDALTKIVEFLDVNAKSNYYSPTIVIKQVYSNTTSDLSKYSITDLSVAGYVTTHYLVNSVEVYMKRVSIGTEYQDTLMG